MNMLEVKQLHQYYGGSYILRGVDLQVKPGEITVLLGRNGVGKTTLLKSLMGLVPVRMGSVQFKAQDITHHAPYRRAALGIGYVPQGREIFARLSVLDNLRMGMASRDASEPIPSVLFEMFPILETMKHRKGGDLSGGQQQQLAIARALAARPSLLILDEPTEGIQPNIIQDIGRVIHRLARVGLWGQPMSVLLCEQYFDFAQELADTYAVMERGEIIASGLGADMARDGVRQLIAI